MEVPSLRPLLPRATRIQSAKEWGRLAIAENGSAKGKIGIGWAGEEALVRRLSGLKTDDAGRKKELEDELKACFRWELWYT